jgi:molybdopterin/thiamine biosynthesis adenylyltransferase
MLRFTDGVIDAIHTHLALVPPEQGAALLGFGDLVTVAVVDSDGSYSAVFWDISAELGKVVHDLETAGVGTLIGTVHSHPRGMVNPSATDISSTAKTLRLNPHLSSLLVAIVTEGPPSAPEHLAVGATHRMSLHAVTLVDDQPRVRGVAATVVSLTAGLSDAGVEVRSSLTGREWRSTRAAVAASLPRVTTWRGTEQLFIGLGDSLALAVPPSYPDAGPQAISFADAEAGPVVLPSPWDPSRGARRQLRNLVRNAPRHRLAGAFDRAEPLVGQLSSRTVVIAGLGSVGSRIAEDLARAGAGRFVVIDPERVEAPNLSRSVYGVDDLDDFKTLAIERRLRSINPAVTVVAHSTSIGAAPLPDVLAEADLVIGATDDMRDQLLLAHHAYAAGLPMVCCSMYRGARAGELIVTLPGADSPCVACCLGDGHAINRFRPDADYGLKGRLVAEPGLGASIQLVASMASMLALGILAGPGSSLEPLITGSIGSGRSLAMVATHPDWDFFPEIFGENGHQLAPQSAWISVARDPACVVCGPAAGRITPPSDGFGGGLAQIIDRERVTPAPRARQARRRPRATA